MEAWFCQIRSHIITVMCYNKIALLFQSNPLQVTMQVEGKVKVGLEGLKKTFLASLLFSLIPNPT